MRILRLLTAILFPVATAAAGAAVVSPVVPQGHPHFDDGGALQWKTQLGAAKTAAKKANKMIFIEYGRAA